MSPFFISNCVHFSFCLYWFVSPRILFFYIFRHWNLRLIHQFGDLAATPVAPGLMQPFLGRQASSTGGATAELRHQDWSFTWQWEPEGQPGQAVGMCPTRLVVSPLWPQLVGEQTHRSFSQKLSWGSGLPEAILSHIIISVPWLLLSFWPKPSFLAQSFLDLTLLLLAPFQIITYFICMWVCLFNIRAYHVMETVCSFRLSELLWSNLAVSAVHPTWGITGMQNILAFCPVLCPF